MPAKNDNSDANRSKPPVARRTGGAGAAGRKHDLIAVIDAHLATGVRHPAGTTDRLRAADRDRRY